MLTAVRAPAPGLAARTALRAAAARTGYLTLVAGEPDGPEWVPLADLLHPTNRDTLIEAAVTRYGGAPTPAARTAAGTLFFGDLASALATPLAVLLTTQRRGLLLAAERIALRLTPAGIDGIALATPALLVLADDPLAGLPGVDVRGDVDDLRAAATASYRQALQPAVDVVRSAVRRGPRAIWAEASERLSQAIFTALRNLGRAGRAPGEIEAALAVSPPELRHPVRWLRVGAGDRELPWRARALCCLAYQTPRWAGDFCTTCPLTPPAESVTRICRSLAGLPDA